MTLTFHTSYAALVARLPVLFERTSTAGMVWVCWPKKAAQKRWAPATSTRTWSATWASSSASSTSRSPPIDEVWSGLKFVRRLKDR